MKVLKGGNVPIKIWTDELQNVESQALDQLRNIARLPFIFKHLAVMPDVHLGKGATVGSVIASKDAICPSAVGVDIGCGMLAVNLHRELDSFNLNEMFNKISAVVPVGFNGHAREKKIGNDLMNGASDIVKSVWKKAGLQMGTLGGGNHFIELCDDGTGNAWLMLHSGSRNVGKSVAEVHIKNAKELNKIWHIPLEDPDLAYLVENTVDFDNYVRDVQWCQDYAFRNRQMMLKKILDVLQVHVNPKTVINCHHNYIARENHYNTNVWVTRKGAVKAREGDMGIIPSAMGQKSFIVKGKGNPESFCSCSHGAGRQFSRSAAKRNFTVDDLIEQTDGVVCRKDAGVVDEIPSAYKNIDQVMENQKDLVDIQTELKAVLCVKG